MVTLKGYVCDCACSNGVLNVFTALINLYFVIVAFITETIHKFIEFEIIYAFYLGNYSLSHSIFS